MTHFRKRHQFPLFTSHLDFAHNYWRQHLKKGDIVIDATMGNGHDTLYLSHIIFPHESSLLIAFDVDQQALIQTRTNLIKNGFEQDITANRIQLIEDCHSKIDIAPSVANSKGKISLIVYNLGYRPGSGHKEKTTMSETTLTSIEKAIQVLRSGGVISITSYPGHPEGMKEKNCIDLYLTELLQLYPEWSLSNHSWVNKKMAPQVYLLQKAVIVE